MVTVLRMNKMQKNHRKRRLETDREQARRGAGEIQEKRSWLTVKT